MRVKHYYLFVYETIEEDQTQERIETINKDQVQVKDIMIEKISVTTVIEQVIQHMSVLNLRTI